MSHSSALTMARYWTIIGWLSSKRAQSPVFSLYYRQQGRDMTQIGPSVDQQRCSLVHLLVCVSVSSIQYDDKLKKWLLFKDFRLKFQLYLNINDSSLGRAGSMYRDTADTMPALSLLLLFSVNVCSIMARFLEGISCISAYIEYLFIEILIQSKIDYIFFFIESVTKS